MSLRFVLTACFYTALSFTCMLADAQTTSPRLSIIPYPSSVKVLPGKLVITANDKIGGDIGLFKNEIGQLNILLKNGLGKPLNIGGGNSKILMQRDANLPGENYKIDISSKNIVLKAGTAAGMFYAIESVRQMLPAEIELPGKLKTINLPAVRIADKPAFSWRGMHLDVSRHFFSIVYLKKYVDIMALYKMNKFHIHLTDDQGWRIEIKQYPKLTELGAWRTFNNQDSACMKLAKTNPDYEIDMRHTIKKNGKTLYGGFYTQQQLKELVAYAAARHIEIIPEIDMPGHMMAAINGYPFLTCNGENKFGELFSKPICPCNPQTFEFAQNIFKEVMAIFPSKYIHIGGDEVDRTEWAKSEECKNFMKEHGIKDLPALHSYFINSMEKFFNSHGKKLIGWDEVIEGGISPTATIMYWRTWVKDAPLKAALNGNSIVMTPGEPLYFDNLPDKNSLKNIYYFNPVFAGLPANKKHLIAGAQANLWTEMVPNEKRADYLVMPRMTALSETVWNGSKDNFEGYLSRLNDHYKRLDYLHVNYRMPDLPDLVTENVFVDSAILSINNPAKQFKLRYTTDGSLPAVSSPILPKTLAVKKSATIKVAGFKPDGVRGDVYTLNYVQQLPAPAVNVITQPRLSVNLYKQGFKQVEQLANSKVDSTFYTDQISVPASITASSFGLFYNGFINVPATGIYTFYLTCDDGGVLRIANRLVVDNNGLHSAREKNGQVALKAGLQPFDLKFIEGGGGYKLILNYSYNGSAPAPIPQAWFRRN